jgi:hypothetical protein
MPQFVFLVLLFTYCGVRAVNVANEWAVEVDGGIEVANIIANKFGLWNRGKIGNLDNHYHFLLLNNSSFNLTKTTNDITAALESETHTKLVQHQIKRKRVKRYYTSPTDIKWSQQWSLVNLVMSHTVCVSISYILYLEKHRTNRWAEWIRLEC